PDGRLAASVGLDGTLRIWEVVTGRCLRVLQAPEQWFQGVGLALGGRLAVTGGWDGTVRVWDVLRGECVRVLRTSPGTSLSATPAGGLAATAGWDNVARVGALAGADTPLLPGAGYLAGHQDIVFTFAWTGDGGSVLTASRDQTVRLWDAAQGTCLHV